MLILFPSSFIFLVAGKDCRSLQNFS